MAIFNGTSVRDIINGTSLADVIRGNGGNDWLRGHGGNDVIRGGSGQDIIEGGAGDDRLYADSNEGGEDVLFGGSGSDILYSGSGRDFFNGGSGIDAASWEESSGGVTAYLSLGRAYSLGVRDEMTQIENLIGSHYDDSLYGDGGSNGLYGGYGDDYLSGFGGDDYLSGGSGNDRLDGGSGVNTLKGGAGEDVADYSSHSSGAIGVYLSQGEAVSLSGDEVRWDRLIEIENVRGTRYHDDYLEGDESANRLDGLGGDDTIDGGEGNDVLSGGSGGDTFVFVAEAPWRFGSGSDSGYDRITDFDGDRGDVIDLSDHKEATNIATLMAEASQFGGDTHLRLGDDTIVVEDYGLNDFSSEMFIF